MKAPRCRRAGAADAELLASLHALCFRPSWDTASFERLLARPGAAGWVVHQADDRPPAGFALCEQVRDEAEILTFGVRPDCRGRGLGRALLNETCAALAGAGVHEIHLEVAADNEPALALYRAKGFVESGRRRGYYSRVPGERPADALVLACRLGPDSRR